MKDQIILFFDTIYGECGFFLSVKFATSLTRFPRRGIKGDNHEGPTKIKQNEYLFQNNPSYAIPCNDIIAC